MHALLAVGKLGDQRDPDGGGQRAKELGGLVEAVDGAAVIHMQRLPYMHGSSQVASHHRSDARRCPSQTTGDNGSDREEPRWLVSTIEPPDGVLV